MLSSNELLRGTYIYVLTTFISSLIAFLLLPFLTRYLNPEEIGLIALFQFFLSIFAVLVGLSVHGAISVQYFKMQKNEFVRFVGSGLLLSIASFLIIFFLINFSSSYIQDINGLSQNFIFLALITSLSQVLINIRLSIWQVMNSPVKYGAFSLALALLTAISSIALIINYGMKDEGRILSISFSIIIFSIFSLATIFSSSLIHFSKESKGFKKALNFGIPLLPHAFATIILLMSDRLILSSKLSLEAAGIYFVAMQLALPINKIGDAFNRAFKPWLFNKISKSEDLISVLVSYISIFGLILMGFIYYIFVYAIYPVFVGEDFQSGRDFVAYIIFGNVFQAMYYSVSNYVLFKEKTIYLSVVTFLTTGLYIFLAWNFVEILGIKGMAILYCSMSICFFVATFFVSQKINPKPWLKFYDLQILLKDLIRKRQTKNFR